MKEKRILVACSIFQDKIEYALKRQDIYEVEVIWLNASFHNDLTLLEEKIKDALGRPEVSAAWSIVRLMYGQACLPHMVEFAGEKNIPLLSAKNCLSAMVGEDKLLEMEQNRTMVITPAWIRKMWGGNEGLTAVLGWDEVDFRINMGRYDKIIVLEPGLKPLSDEEIITCYDLIQVPLEIEPCSMEYFQKRLYELLA